MSLDFRLDLDKLFVSLKPFFSKYITED